MSRRDLTHGAVQTRLTELTLPMVWGVFMVLSFYLADTYFIGLLGTQELAAISFTFPVVSATASLAMGLGVGALSVISRAIGRGDQEAVRRYATHSLVLAIFIVGIFVIIGLATIDPLFLALGADPALLPMIRQYMEIWYAGMIFLIVPMVGNSIIRASGDSRLPSLIMTVAAVSNFILDPIFIFGLLGFPRLELQGAAWASLVSRAITMVASFYILHYRLKFIEFIRPSLRQLLQSWRAILHIGLPAAGTNIITPILTGLLTVIIAKHGSVAVAAFGVASRMEMFFLVPFVALSAGLGPFMGQNYGAKKQNRLQEAVRLSTVFALMWGGFVALTLWFWGEEIAREINAEPQVVAYVAIYMALIPVSYAAVGIVFTSSAAFNALANPMSASMLAITRTFILTVPMAWFGHVFWGMPGIFAAISLANLTVGVVAYFWIRKKITLKGGIHGE
jgi:putative MATE family efflux protein